jgi:hypothetical protein
VIAPVAPPPVVFQFDRPVAVSGEHANVTLRRLRTTRTVRVYLVAAADAGRVRSALDRRLQYVGSVKPSERPGTLSFLVPPLSGRYRAWCSGCGSGGTLRVTMPTATCPVTTSGTSPPPGLSGDRYNGNGALWGFQPANGVFTARPQDVDADGIWTKLFWWAAGIDGTFSLSGRRLDAPAQPLRVRGVNRGTQTGFRGSGTWATVVTFPSAGCWRLTARVDDRSRRVGVNLSFVIKVVAP